MSVWNNGVSDHKASHMSLVSLVRYIALVPFYGCLHTTSLLSVNMEDIVQVDDTSLHTGDHTHSVIHHTAMYTQDMVHYDIDGFE